jgi:hypothetical protein
MDEYVEGGVEDLHRREVDRGDCACPFREAMYLHVRLCLLHPKHTHRNNAAPDLNTIGYWSWRPSIVGSHEGLAMCP